MTPLRYYNITSIVILQYYYPLRLSCPLGHGSMLWVSNYIHIKDTDCAQSTMAVLLNRSWKYGMNE